MSTNMWKEMLTAAWLIPMSAMDIRSRQVPAWMLWIGTAAAVVVLACEGWSGELSGWQICKAAVPGAVLLAIAGSTGRAGYADGIVLLLLGLLAGYEICLTASLGGLFLIAMCSLVLLALRRVRRDTKMPFVPFLTAGWLAAVCGRWGIV